MYWIKRLSYFLDLLKGSLQGMANLRKKTVPFCVWQRSSGYAD